MQLSVIVPTFKRVNALEKAYNAIVLATSGYEAEIIIINDDSSVSPQGVLRSDLLSPNTIVVNNTKSGVASARNLGASLAKGKLLLFVDDDVLISKGNLDQIVQLHNHLENVILSPTWKYPNEIMDILNQTPFGIFRLKYDYPATVPRGRPGNGLAGYPHVYNTDSLSSFCLSMNKTIYDGLHGMDESFPFAGCEDQEFSMRAHKAGFSLLIDESNVVIHDESHRLDPDLWLKRQYTGVQGFVIFAQLNPERKKTSLWYENTPINSNDSFALKFKKSIKSLLIKDPSIAALHKIRVALEKIKMPYIILEQIYKLQAGAYINKGFTESYKRL